MGGGRALEGGEEPANAALGVLHAPGLRDIADVCVVLPDCGGARRDFALRRRAGRAGRAGRAWWRTLRVHRAETCFLLPTRSLLRSNAPAWSSLVAALRNS